MRMENIIARRYIKAQSALLIGAAALLIGLRIYSLTQEQNLFPARLTTQQVLDQSEGLCRIIAPQAESQSLSIQSVNGPTGRQWTVTSRDRAGNQLVALTWNADTGELSRVSSSPPNLGSDRPPLLSKQAALQRMRNWVNVLTMRHEYSRWNPVGVPTCAKGKMWAVAWRGERRKALVGIEAHTGDLIQYFIWHEKAGGAERH